MAKGLKFYAFRAAAGILEILGLWFICNPVFRFPFCFFPLCGPDLTPASAVVIALGEFSQAQWPELVTVTAVLDDRCSSGLL